MTAQILGNAIVLYVKILVERDEWTSVPAVQSEYVVLTRMVEYKSLIVENSLKNRCVAPVPGPVDPEDDNP